MAVKMNKSGVTRVTLSFSLEEATMLLDVARQRKENTVSGSRGWYLWSKIIEDVERDLKKAVSMMEKEREER